MSGENTDAATSTAASTAMGTTLNSARLLSAEHESIYALEVRSGSLDEIAIELGIYFVALTFCMLVLLDQVRGKPKKLHYWLLFRKIAIFR